MTGCLGPNGLRSCDIMAPLQCLLSLFPFPTLHPLCLSADGKLLQFVQFTLLQTLKHIAQFAFGSIFEARLFRVASSFFFFIILNSYKLQIICLCLYFYRILWKKNEVADYEATTFSIFYNNALYLVLLIVISFYIVKNLNPTVYPLLLSLN